MRNTSLFKTSGEKGKMTVSIKLIDHHVEGQLVLNFKKLKVSFCLPYGERKRKATSLNKSSYMCKAKKKKKDHFWEIPRFVQAGALPRPACP